LYRIRTPLSFLRTAKKFFKRHPELKKRFADIVELLRRDPLSSVLKIHPLREDLKGLHVVSLSYKYRITLIIKFTVKAIILIDIGSHDEVSY